LSAVAAENAPAMAEQFALDQVFGDRGAVDLDEHGIFAQALRVQRARRQFLAGTRLAVDQHPSVGRRHQRDLLAQRLHGNAVAHDHAARLKLLLEFQVLAAQPLGLDGILQNDEGALDGERFLQEVEGAEFGGAHCGLDVAVARDHDHLGVVFALHQLFQGLQTVDAGQPDIQQDDVRRLVSQNLDALFTTAGEQGLVAFIRQHALQRAADLRLVIDNQDGLHVDGGQCGA
jgi:hypothetical protein